MAENVFIDDPIVVNVLDIESFNTPAFSRIIRRHVVWPNTTKKNILDLWKKKNREGLKKHYGRDMLNILDTKSGGDEVTFGDDLISLLEEPVSTPPGILKTKEIHDEHYDNTDVVVSDIFMLLDDKISDFKRKIFAATGIPPFRQHLWYEFDGDTYPLGYRLVHLSDVDIDIRTINEHSSYFDGIPVDPRLHAEKDNIRIIATDDFQLLESIYYKHGTTIFYVVDLNDFVNPVRDNIKKIIQSDRYATELIYHSFIVKYWPHLSLSVFGEYISDEKNLYRKYPLLSPRIADVIKRYTTETTLIQKDKHIGKKNEPMNISITRGILKVTNEYVIYGMTVHIRNLFDKIELGGALASIACRLNIEGHPILLKKVFGNNKIHDVRQLNTNAASLGINTDDGDKIILTIYEGGGYQIDVTSRTDRMLLFDDIYKVVDDYISPIISTINGYGKSVVSHNLPMSTANNSTFSYMDLTIVYPIPTSKTTFKNLKDMTDQYIASGIMTKPSFELKKMSGGDMWFQFNKGMHIYNTNRYKYLLPDTYNEFLYLSDSCANSLYVRHVLSTKTVNITHRSFDINVAVKGLRSKGEYSTVYTHISRLFMSMDTSNRKKQADVSMVDKVKSLRNNDPVLFDLKHHHGSDRLYSKICQGDKRPTMYVSPGKNRVKYWNFTTRGPVYYGCNSSEYPYINFITDVHPDKYCIPCCYKNPPLTDKKNIKSKKYMSCIENHEYTTTGKASSRYIMTYGKHISVGRISTLPESTIEPLIYDSYSVDGKNSTDDECIHVRNLYVYGVPQYMKNVSNIGFLFAAGHAMGKNIIQFIHDTIDRLRKHKKYWNMLLGGKIHAHFETLNDLVDDIRNVFIDDGMSDFTEWNLLFIDIVSLYWGVSVIHYIDIEGISLRIPAHIKHAEDYISQPECIVIIEKDNMFYPIYNINKSEFDKTGRMRKKVFNRKDRIVSVVYDVISSYLKKKRKTISIDLRLITDFVNQYDYSIVSKYINSSNNCYGVNIKRTSDKKNIVFNGKSHDVHKNKYSFYIPITESIHGYDDDIQVSFDPPNSNDVPHYSELLLFMVNINKFINKISKKNTSINELMTYSPLGIENWIILSDIKKKNKSGNANGCVIGFASNNLTYMIKPIKIDMADKIKKTKMIRQLYNPLDVNNIMSKVSQPERDKRMSNINKSTYNHYLYQIMLIELVNIMHNERNVTIRKKLEKIISDFKMSGDHMKKLYELLEEYPIDYAIIRDKMYNIALSRGNSKTITAPGKENRYTKSELLDIINNSMFTFDRVMFNKFQSYSHDELVRRLHAIFKKITVDKKPTFTDGDFPNILSSCETKHPYCQGKKLMIRKKDMNTLIDIMASDIKNPLKSKYIFSPIFIKSVIDVFKFTIRKNENITISI